MSKGARGAEKAFMKLRLFVSLALALAAFGLTSGVAAQSYSFSLDQETVNVYWNSDGTVSLDYLFVFTNDPDGHVIDFVDVGMPVGEYSGVSADVGGQAVAISSNYEGRGPYGFAVNMGSHAIQSGKRGSLHVFVSRITGMIYPDDQDADTMVSSEFSPTWFGSAYVHGGTDLTVTFHLPPGVRSQEPRYHPEHGSRGAWTCSAEPEVSADDQDRITYTWACPGVSASTQYTFGLSFPKRYVPSNVIVDPDRQSLDLRSIWYELMHVLNGTYGGLYAVLLCGIVPASFAAAIRRRNKLTYLPPRVQIEGHGIRRGLTAVEAAVLMEQPLDKVMTMILFGLVKKNAAGVIHNDPLRLDVASPLPVDLYAYEQEFLQAFAGNKPDAQRKNLQEMTVNLVKSVAEKMRGFSRKETLAYYRSIMERAWQQVEAAGTPEVKSQLFDESLEWTMLDRDYDGHTRRVFSGPIYVPRWWGRYDPDYQPAGTSAAFGSGGRTSIPGSSFAASVIAGVQGFSSRVLGGVSSFTSGVTGRTNPGSVSTSGGGSRGGGGSCACACAGCASACAGGGR